MEIGHNENGELFLLTTLPGLDPNNQRRPPSPPPLFFHPPLQETPRYATQRNAGAEKRSSSHKPRAKQANRHSNPRTVRKATDQSKRQETNSLEVKSPNQNRQEKVLTSHGPVAIVKTYKTQTRPPHPNHPPPNKPQSRGPACVNSRSRQAGTRNSTRRAS